jgi:biofilm PGA synthesis N-glycosyltransferase PgaC
MFDSAPDFSHIKLAGSDAPPIVCSVGIMAYNEATNIANAIASILRQPLAQGSIAEVIVVASGCTDDTVPIVADLARKETRVRLIVQQRREGKASAINQFLRAAHSPILVMASADVVLKEGTLDALLAHFQDPTIGMVGAHPIPINDERTFLGATVHLLWRLHDQIARSSPKLGEVVAFRNVVPSIPLDTPVDEISIQAVITQLGYRLIYEPRAIVYNRGPSTIADFLRQRRRIYAGHLLIQQQQGYAASTMSVSRVVGALAASRPLTSPRAAVYTLGAVGIETFARAMGAYDYARRRPQHIWAMATTTKAHIGEAGEPRYQSVLVFRIIDFHLHTLELGARDSQSLVQQVAQRIKQQMAEATILSAERSGTIVVLLPRDRDGAQEAAGSMTAAVESAPLRSGGRPTGVAIKLALGIITLMESGEHAASVTALPTAV